MAAALFLLHGGTAEDRDLLAKLLTVIEGVRDRLQVLPAPAPGTDVRAGLLLQIATADAALILLSKVLLSQDRKTEIAALQARKDAGMPVFPVLLRPCLWTEDPRFACLQVLPRDGTPLSAQPDKDQACGDIVRELLLHVPAPAPAQRTVPAHPDGRVHYSLTLELLRTGSEVSVRYLDPYQQATPTTAPQRLRPARDPDGEQIYDLLFPEQKTTQRVLSALFHAGPGESPTPPRHPVRVRLSTRDPDLCALPWQRCAYLGRPLLEDGWTFEVCPEGEPRNRETLLAPAKVLVLALDGPAGFVRALAEKLGRLSRQRLHPSLYRVVRSAAELSRELFDLRPHLLLCQGRGTADGYADLPFSALRALFQEVHRPLVVFLGGSPAQTWPAAAQVLCPAAPLVVVARPGAPAVQVELLLTAWLGRFLGEGVDPVMALHDEWPSHPAAPVMVHASYGHMDVRAEQERPPLHDRAPLLLDRDEPRALADKHILELQDSRHRRVEVLIAYADQGNHLEEFGEQATEYVQRRQKGLRRVRLSVPPHRADLKEDLERELRVQTGAEAHTPLQQVLRSLLRGRGGGQKTTLFLDYGVFGEGQQTPLLGKELLAFLEFARDHVGRACPDDLRVVGYLAMLVPRARQEVFRANMDRLLAEDRLLFTDRFRFTLLPALDSVTLRHLHEFLSNSDRSSCGAGLAWDAATVIFTHSGGDYEKAVALLRKAEATTYEQLIAELRGQRAKPEQPGDDSLF